MKKLLIILILSVAMVSCYKDYIKDYTSEGVYFPFQTDVRTMVVGEGMKIQIGVDLGGVMENTKDRIVNFKLDNSLITPAILTSMKNSSLTYIKNGVSSVSTLLPLPANYFTLSNSSTMVIKSGQHMGSVVLKVDSAAFLADAATLNPNYVLPFYITDAKPDSILVTKRYAIIAVKYENMLFGNYWHGGVTRVDSAGVSVKPIIYYTSIPTTENKIWVLTTIGPNSLVAHGYSNQITTKNEMTLTLNETNITVSSATGSTYIVLPDGASTFNRAKLLQDRRIVLSYKYVSGVKTFYAQDTLTFRNRIHDGVNEWQN